MSCAVVIAFVPPEAVALRLPRANAPPDLHHLPGAPRGVVGKTSARVIRRDDTTFVMQNEDSELTHASCGGEFDLPQNAVAITTR